MNAVIARKEMRSLVESTMRFVVGLIPAAETLYAQSRRGLLSETLDVEELEAFVVVIEQLRALAASALKLSEVMARKVRD